MGPRKLAGVLLPAAVSVALLLLLTRGIPWGKLAASVTGASRAALAVYALTSLAGLWLRAVRFRLLLPRPRPAATEVLLVTAVQNSLGDLVPGRLAALGSYVYLLVSRHAVGLESAAATFVLSFAFDLVTLGPLLALAALMRFEVVSPALRSALPLGWVAALAAGLFLASAAATLEMGALTRALSRVVRGAAFGAGSVGRRRQALAARLDTLGAALAEVRRAGTLVPAFFVSVAIRLVKYGSLYALMTALFAGAGAGGRQPDFWDLILGISATELIASLPIPALGQFGVWEGGMIGALLLLGYDREPATIVSIGIHGITQAFEYLLGFAALGILAATASGSSRRGRTPRSR